MGLCTSQNSAMEAVVGDKSLNYSDFDEDLGDETEESDSKD